MLTYYYVRTIDHTARWVTLAPLSRQFLEDGLFNLEPAAPPENAVPDNVCVVTDSVDALFPGGSFRRTPWQRDFDTPPSASTHAVGPDPMVPFTSMFNPFAGSPTGDQRHASVQSRIEQALGQQGQRAQSQQGWRGHRTGPPLQRPPAVSRPVNTGPMSSRSVRGGGIASLFATAMLGLNRESMVYALRAELDRLRRQIRHRMDNGRGRVLCAATYSFLTFTDSIGNNRPELATIVVYNPDSGGSGFTATSPRYDLLSNAFPRPPGSEPGVVSHPGFIRQFGDIMDHGAANRQLATAYIFASR